MFRTMMLAGLAASAIATAGAAFAQSGYGTEGPYGQRLHARAQTTFDRHWNAANESKHRAEASAEWLRQRGKGFPSPF